MNKNFHLDMLLLHGAVGASVLLAEGGVRRATGCSRWAGKAADNGAHFVRCDEIEDDLGGK